MRLIAAIILVPIVAFSNPSDPIGSDKTLFARYFEAFLKVEGANLEEAESFDKFLSKIKRTSGQRDDLWQLRHVFAKTHNKYLKHYRPYATFAQLFDKGVYNCLTATALYALLLEDLGYNYSIVETNYHIFLLVETSKGRVLIETTDPLAGFVTDEDEISATITRYVGNDSPNASLGNYYQYSMSLYNEVSLENFPGLLHYNMAVEHYNQRNLEEAVRHFESARSFYDSERLKEFSRILLLTVVESPLQQETKASLIKRIQSVRRNTQPVLVRLD